MTVLALIILLAACGILSGIIDVATQTNTEYQGLNGATIWLLGMATVLMIVDMITTRFSL